MSLRNKIKEIIDKGITDEALSAQIIELKELFKKDGREIELIEKRSLKTGNYNCYSYALRIPEGKSLRALPKSVYDWVHEGVLVEDPDGEIVLYLDETKRSFYPVHAGVWDNGKVISKWGSGHVWRHELWDVPVSYMNDARRYKVVQPEEVERYCEDIVALQEHLINKVSKS